MEPMDYKKAYADLYLPKAKPMLIQVPEMPFICVAGSGDPNEPDGCYSKALALLYGLSFTIKMSPKAGVDIDGYFAYKVPPLEGLWWQDGSNIDFSRKQDFHFISMIRQPDFVTEQVFDWACAQVKQKKPDLDVSAATLTSFAEGLCVQMLHIGPYDTEPETLAILHDFMQNHGLVQDISETRRHHEIYLSDPRRTKPERCKTVLRIPVKRLEE